VTGLEQYSSLPSTSTEGGDRLAIQPHDHQPRGPEVKQVVPGEFESAQEIQAH